MLKITHFSKSYQKGVKACDDLNLEIEKGDIFGFVGHNGAGKTTLLKSIAGILDFEEGEITFDRYSIKRDPMAFKKRLAYIPDNPDVYESLTGIQYLNFVGDVFQVPLEKRRALIEEYAKMFEIEGVLANPMSSYSHGMKQKLVLTSALIHEPELLILDEPFVGLDPKASFLLKNVLKQMCDRGMAIFFSTHVLEVVEKLCNKIAIIKKGRLVAQGATNDLLKDQSLESIFMEINQN